MLSAALPRGAIGAYQMQARDRPPCTTRPDGADATERRSVMQNRIIQVYYVPYPSRISARWTA